jgi:hypothetical protein
MAKLKFTEANPWKADRKTADISTDYQTPLEVVKYMASLIPSGVRTVLEPTPGIGNIVGQLKAYEVTAPKDFFLMDRQRFDCIIMNPPFSTRSAIMEHAPAALHNSGMRVGYYFLTECMKMSDNVIALMPWFTLTDSDNRMRMIKSFGLKSLTALPRKTFSYARIQTCVMQLQKGFEGETSFRVFDLINPSMQLKAAI